MHGCSDSEGTLFNVQEGSRSIETRLLTYDIHALCVSMRLGTGHVLAVTPGLGDHGQVGLGAYSGPCQFINVETSS